ncbi:MAG: hypothetical protein DI534_16455, partial [Leifsonia xyli]
MASRVVETKLLLTGEDQASRVLREVAKATGSVTRTLAEVAKASGPASKAFAEVAKATKVSAEVDRLTKSLQRTAKAAGEFDAFRKARAEVASTEATLKLARARMTEVGKALDGAKKAADAYASTKAATATAEMAAKATAAAREVAKLAAEHKAVEREVRTVQSVMRAQTSAFEAARSAVRAYGVPIQDAERHQQALRRTIEQTTKAIREQEAAEKAAATEATRRLKAEDRRLQRRADRREMVGTAVAAGGAYAGYKAKIIAGDAISSVKAYDEAVRYQHIAGGISEEKQRTVMIPSATRIAQETRYSNTDTIEAQTSVAQGLPMKDPDVKADVAAAITEEARHYAVIMKSDMTTAAEGIRSFLQTTQKDISTAEKAVAEAGRGTRLVVAMSKSGGLSDEDAQQYIKYAFPTATAAGLSDLTTAAIGSVGRRSGLRGDELGVFMRATASKLVAPTSKGRDALAAAGIDYDKFTKMPGGLSADTMEGFFKRRFGKGFSADQRAQIADLLEDSETIADRETFTSRLSGVLEDSFAKDKKGKISGPTANKIAKMLGDYHKLSVESVDAEGLLAEILSNPRMTLMLKNAFFTDKHGGKAAIVGSQFGQLAEDRAAIQKATEDPNYASDKSKYMIAGVSGSLENLEGSWENFVLKIGEANEGVIKFTSDGLSGMLNAFSNLNPEIQKWTSLVGGGAAIAAGGGGAYALARKLTGAGALTGSATHLHSAATALEVAAAKLGASGQAGMVDKASKALPATAAAGAIAPWTALLAPAAIAGAGVVGSFHGNAVAGEQLRVGLDRRKAEREGNDLPYLKADIEKLRTELAANERRAAEIGDDMDRAPVLMALRSRKTAIEASIRDIEAKIAERLKNGPIDLGLDALSAVARPGGQAVGEVVGKGVADGVKSKAPEVLEEGKALFKRMKDVFAPGIAVPLRYAPESGGGFGGAGGGLIRASLGGDDPHARPARSIGPAEGGGWAIRETAASGGAGAGRESVGPVAALPVDDGPGAGHIAPREERAAYIREAARKRGIDPETALRVAQSEGFNDYTGDQGRSF